MAKLNRKQTVYMDYLCNDKGFTLISFLLVMVLISFTFPLISHVLKLTSFKSNYEDISVNHYFHFLRDELLDAVDYEIHGKTLFLQLPNGKKSSFRLYKDYILRQVNSEGHEIYLRNVKEIKFYPLSYGIQTVIVTTEGDRYEKSIILYE